MYLYLLNTWSRAINVSNIISRRALQPHAEMLTVTRPVTSAAAISWVYSQSEHKSRTQRMSDSTPHPLLFLQPRADQSIKKNRFLQVVSPPLLVLCVATSVQSFYRLLHTL